MGSGSSRRYPYYSGTQFGTGYYQHHPTAYRLASYKPYYLYEPIDYRPVSYEPSYYYPSAGNRLGYDSYRYY